MSVVELTRAFTFDCYGTLIDWEHGIRTALAGVESLAGIDLDDPSPSGFLARREAAELEVEGEAYRPYDVVLAESLRRTAARFGRSVGASEAIRFAASLAYWEPFPEAPPSYAGSAAQASRSLSCRTRRATDCAAACAHWTHRSTPSSAPRTRARTSPRRSIG